MLTPQELIELNGVLVSVLTRNAVMEVSKLAIQKFLYTGLVAAVAPPLALVTVSTVIDTPWQVALNRAVKVRRGGKPI